MIISRKRKEIWTGHFFIFCNLAIDSENLILKNSWRENNHKCLENWKVQICDGIRDSWIKCLKWSDQSNFSIFELKVCLSPNFAQIKHFYIVQIPSKSKDKDKNCKNSLCSRIIFQKIHCLRFCPACIYCNFECQIMKFLTNVISTLTT